MFHVVGHCPACGAPIYGKTTVEDNAAPSAKYTCNCRNKKPEPLRLPAIPKPERNPWRTPDYPHPYWEPRVIW